MEPFPRHMEEGFFDVNDVAVSLRNINTVFVFDRTSGDIKFVDTGTFLQQHDPDFIDGNHFSVFDNRKYPEQSRIATMSAPDGHTEIDYEGTGEAPFFTKIMGKHQWLRNGNLLIVESMKGRAFEVSPCGEIVWEYRNLVGDGVAGFVTDVQRLPPEYERLFLPQ